MDPRPLNLSSNPHFRKMYAVGLPYALAHKFPAPTLALFLPYNFCSTHYTFPPAAFPYLFSVLFQPLNHLIIFQ